MIQVFISYKRQDEDFARRLRDIISSWGYRTWLDIENIPIGTTPGSKGWDDAVHTGMRLSQVVIGLFTPESLASPNVLDEWGWALSNDRRLILLWLRDVPEEDIPPRYIRIQRLDLRHDAESGLELLRRALARPSVTISFEQQRPHQPPPPVNALQMQNRQRMLQKVHDMWITGVLEKALHGREPFEIELTIAPDMVLKHLDYGDYELQPGADIYDIFAEMSGELLILGPPGSGKTILLLQLARQLIHYAFRDPLLPIPVVFNIVSWTTDRKPLDKWLVDELLSKYRVPSRVGIQWVQKETLLLLLDGLDEVGKDYGNDCIEFINQHREQYPYTDLVICSRVVDYQALTNRLDLRSAVELQPLSPQQIFAYVAANDLHGMQEVMKTDQYLINLASVPFFLNAMAFAYRGMSASNLRLPTATNRESHLLGRYVERSLRLSLEETPYTPRQARRYLTWLASEMIRHGQSVFYIETLDVDWLPTAFHKRVYSTSFRLPFVLVSFSLAWLISEMYNTASYGWISGVASALIAGTLDVVWGSRIVEALKAQTFVLTRQPIIALIGTVLGGLMGSFIGGLVGDMPAEIQAVATAQWLAELENSVISAIGSGFVGALVGGTASGVVTALVNEEERVKPVEKLTWSWEEVFLNQRRAIPAGCISGIVASTAVCLITFVQATPFRYAVPIVLVGGSIAAIGIWILLSLLYGVVGKEIEIRTEPNQGIRYSRRNARIFGPVIGVVLGVILWLGISLIAKWINSDRLSTFAATAGIIAAIISGTGGALTYGGFAASKHFILRLVLQKIDKIPRDYEAFLYSISQHQLMRRVGGGFIFHHGTILEYFADLQKYPKDMR